MVNVVIGCMGFNGFYESIYSNSDEFLDSECDDKDLLVENGCSDDIEVTYEYNDYNQYKLDVSKNYLELFIEQVIDVLPCEITDKNNFELEFISDSIELYSPTDYNNNYDRVYCQIETNYETLQLIKDYTLNLKGAKQFLLDNFTSYDGYTSFLKNDIDYWKSLDIKEYHEAYLSALFSMLIYLDDKNIFRKLNVEVANNVSKYEYTVCYVYENDIKYEFNEFLKLNNIEL